MSDETKRYCGNGPKRTKAMRERDIAEIAEKWADGWTQLQITQWLGENRPYRLCRTSIIRDCHAAEEIWMQRAAEAIDRRRARELAKLDRLERKALDCFEQSKKESTKTEVVRTGKPGEDNDKARGRITKETRDGNPAFLAAALQCIRDRCRLLGLDAPTKTELSGPDGQAITVAAVKSEGPIPEDHLEAMILEKLRDKVTPQVEGAKPETVSDPANN